MQKSCHLAPCAPRPDELSKPRGICHGQPFSAHGPLISTSPQGEVKAVAGQQHERHTGVCVHYLSSLAIFVSSLCVSVDTGSNRR